MEALEASDEGKEKSKFKSFKRFFGKKKKKEPEDAQEKRRLKPSLSSDSINISSVKPVWEGQQTKPRAKSSMGNKALSHDSIFMLDSESKRSGSRICSSPEVQRGRLRQRSHDFRTLTRVWTDSMHGAVFGAMPQYVPRSGVWVAGTKITEIPPWHPRQPSISPPLIRSDTVSKDFEEISVDDELPKSPRKKGSSHMTLTLKKSSLQHITQRSETSNLGEPLPIEPKQGKPSLPLASEEEESTTKPKEADQKKPKKDSTGASGWEQRNKTGIYEQKTTDQAANRDAAESQGYPFPATYRRQSGRRGSSTSETSEHGSKGRSLKPSSQALGLGNGAGSPPAGKTARDFLSWHLPLEKQVMEQPPTAQTESATPQELLSDKDDMGRGNAGIDFEARKESASQPIPEDMEGSRVSGLSPSHEDGASGAKKTEARAALLPVVGSPSTPQDIFSVTLEDQVFMEPSHSQSEEEEASSFDLKSVQFKMKSAQDTYKEKSPGNVLQALTASISDTAGALVEGGISAERLPPRSLSLSSGKLKAEAVASDAESTSEAGEGSGFGQQRAPRHSLQPLRKSKDGQEVFAESSFVQMSSSDERVVSRWASQALGEPEDEVATGSNSYVEKDNSAEDWSSFEENLPPRPPSQALGRPKDQKEVSWASKNVPGVWGASVQKMPPRHPFQSWLGPTSERQASAGPESAAVESGIAMEPRPPRVTSQAPMRPVVKQPMPAGPESVDVEGGASTKLLPSKPSRSTVRPKLQQMSSSEGAAIEVGISERSLPPKYPAQSVKEFKVEEMSSRLESTAVEEGISKDLVLPSHLFQLFMKFMVQHVFLESPSTEEGVYVDPLSSNQPSKSLSRPKVEHQVFSGYEGTDIEGGIFWKQLPTKGPLPRLGRPEGLQEVFSRSESTPVKWSSSKEQLPCRHPGQAEDEAGFQPQTFSTGPVSAPVEWRGSGEQLSPRHPFQAPAAPEHQQQVYARPMSSAAEGTMLESDPSCWSLPRDPAPPNKTKKHSQGSEDLIKNTLIPATKTVKFTDAPVWQTSTAEGTYSKEEVLESGDRDNSHSTPSTNQADVENVFGVRLRKTSPSQKYKGEKKDFTKLPSVSQRGPPLDICPHSLTRIPIWDIIVGKAPGRQSDHATSEPAWITMIKQRQGSLQANIPVEEPKTKNRAGAKAETKEPRYGRTGLANEDQPRRVFTSDVNRQEKMAPKPPRSTKAVGFEDAKIFQVPSMEKETRRSSTLPAMLQQPAEPAEPAEPVWFSLAKKKAKAWSHVAKTKQ
ncbi:acrosomal protein KIAA1210 homolog [Physeter macrocephalus]|uniref:Acrosomal protein KIAA1210 homolog n=1 Tax=Physeter macrocephalus TaxID=9755 RepID=A0A2Y9T4V6_PHYMC|nr:acrosomal protein KIAA1210 homolog [Physeter catodon]|eukprot:XP_023983835.1 acrosomal protein KIAA1210 homolog [Physeter catodon]